MLKVAMDEVALTFPPIAACTEAHVQLCFKSLESLLTLNY